MIKYFKLILLMLLCTTVSSQTPFYRNYTTAEYNASTQNWSMVQDHRGIMYFANNEGVLEYDGSTWRTIKTKTTVRALTISEDHTIYVGMVNDFGKLVPDGLGFYQFHSIKDEYPGYDLESKDIWRIQILGDEIFFCSFEKIIRLKEGKVKVYLPEDRFTYTFNIENELYVHAQGKGILKYDGQNLNHLEGTDLFGDTRIYTLLPFEKDKLLVGAREVGLKVYSLKSHKILHSYTDQFEEASQFLNEAKVYCGIKLENDNYLIGTLTGGLIEMTPKGKITREYNFENGLQSNAIYSINYDRNGHLWVTMSKGIANINQTLPFTYYSRLDGLNGTIFSLEHHNDVTYIATEQKSYKLLPDHSIEVINGTIGQNWYLMEARGDVLFAHNPQGFLSEKGDYATPIDNSHSMVAVAFSDIPDNPDFLLAGAHQGFFILEHKTGKWKVRNQIKGFDQAIYSFAMENQSTIWVRCSPDDLYRLRLDKDWRRIISLEKMNTESSILSDNGMLNPYKLNNGKIIFGANNGVYTYDESRKEFSRYSPMKDLSGEVNPIMQDRQGNLWYEESKDGRHYKGFFKSQNDDWIQTTTPFLKFATNEIYKGPTKTIIEDEDGMIYFGMTSGLLIYDPSLDFDNGSDFQTSIRRVHVSDSLMNGGHGLKESSSKLISFDSNDIKFEYAGHYYQDNDMNQYSYRLIGEDTTWSEWTSIPLKEYTNLSHNDYTFQVKAKNIYNLESSIDSYEFTILKPWYKTWLALLGYITGLCFLMMSVVRFNSSRMRARNEELEIMVKSRTTELEKEKEKSEHLSHNLLRMFSIIGHDLRKPALSFRGITSKINFFLQNHDFKSLEKLGITIEKDAHSLMSLTDNLLNWTLSQKNIMPYKPVKVSIKKVAQNTLDTFSNLASDKKIEIRSAVQGDHNVFADMNSVHMILRNLVDNAIKYTPDEGEIFINSKELDGFIQIQVSDNGVGISKSHQKILFTLEKGKSKKGTKGESGTGLGLHLVYEMVQINKGEILIESELSQGSIFKVTLPIYQ